MREYFREFAHVAACAMGTSWVFFLASVVVVLWGITGPVFGFSDTWQLVINTGTSVVAFLVVFLIQSTQNREAIHLKLDELLRAIAKARTGLVGIEHMSEEELKRLEQQFITIKAKQTRQQKGTKTSGPLKAGR